MQTWPQNGQSKLFFQQQRARAMPQPFVQPTPGELQTIRDWLRFAVTSFTHAQLEFGHGTDNALDEAAFVILSCLDLEPDSLETWLECRLTTAEGRRHHRTGVCDISARPLRLCDLCVR